MFRRSLLVFVAFLFLVLLLTVGYALLGLSGPETTIDEAELAFEQGRFADVTRHLELINESASAATIQRALRLRFRAHQRLGNRPQALADVELLLERYAPDDILLRFEKTWMLLSGGDTAQALAEAEKALAAQPDHAYASELAAKTTQADYETRIAATFAALANSLARETFHSARSDLLLYLYRPPGDPIGLRAKTAFDAILRRYREQDHIVRKYEPAFDSIRTGIAKARDHAMVALETDRAAPLAFSVLAEILRSGQRFDQLLALSETYLRRFPDNAAELAAAHIVETHLATGQPRAAAEAAVRYLPRGSWQAGRHRFGPDLARLLLANARALRALRDREGLALLAAEVDAMHAGGVWLSPHDLLIKALDAQLAGRAQDATRLLEEYSGSDLARRDPGAGDDPLSELLRGQLALLRETGAADDRFETLFEMWINARPERAEPLLERARFHVERARGQRALDDAARAQELAGQDDSVLAVYAAAADLAHAAQERDARAMLRECVRLGTPLPRSAALDALYLPLARLALEQDRADIALAASRRAAQAYPWAREPRLLQARAALASRDADQALQALEVLRERDPDDAEAVALMRDALLAARRTPPALLFDLALGGVADPLVASELLERARARNDRSTVQRAAATSLATFGNDDRVALAAGLALAAIGNGGRARAVLDRLLDHPAAAVREPAAAACLLHEAARPDNGDTAVGDLLSRLSKASTSRLTDLAEALDERGQPALAYDVLERILVAAEHAATRSGRHYVLAGKLALELQLADDAERHLTAALTFADGRDASRPLTLLLLQARRAAEAADTFWEDRVEDLAGACLAIRFGRATSAQPWIEKALARNPISLAALLLRHMPGVALDRPAPITAMQPLVAQARDDLLDLLAYGETPGFELAAMEAARALRARFPEDLSVRVLWCRALGRAGRVAEAIGALTALGVANPNFPPLLDELVALLDEHAPYAPLPPEIEQSVVDIALVKTALASPRLQLRAVRDLAAKFRAVGDERGALRLLASFWKRHPAEAKAGAAELEALLQAGLFEALTDVLEALDPVWPADDRAGYLKVFGNQAGRALVAGAPDEVLERLHQGARALLERDGPHGALVHFLLHLEETRNGRLRAPTETGRADPRVREVMPWLLGHVQLFERGTDTDVAALVVTLQRLEQLEGAAWTLAKIDALLRTDLSLLPLWELRAAILERIGEPEAALRSLQWVPAYVDDPDLLAEIVRLATQRRLPLAEAVQSRFDPADPRVSGHVRGRLAAGLLALRSGRHAEAAELLAFAEERLDGARQFYLALALLPDRSPKAGKQARDAFEQLAASFPTSAFAELAGHLARQLRWETAAGATPR
jgi:hypothetical protein